MTDLGSFRQNVSFDKQLNYRIYNSISSYLTELKGILHDLPQKENSSKF